MLNMLFYTFIFCYEDQLYVENILKFVHNNVWFDFTIAGHALNGTTKVVDVCIAGVRFSARLISKLLNIYFSLWLHIFKYTIVFGVRFAVYVTPVRQQWLRN